MSMYKDMHTPHMDSWMHLRPSLLSCPVRKAFDVSSCAISPFLLKQNIGANSEIYRCIGFQKALPLDARPKRDRRLDGSRQ